MRLSWISCLLSAMGVVISVQREAHARSWAEEVDTVGTVAPDDGSSETPSSVPDSDNDVDAPRPGYKLETQYRLGPLIAGAAIEATFYGLSLAAALSEKSLRPLAVPLAGPWIALATIPSAPDPCANGDCCNEPGCHGDYGLGQAILIIDGLSQVTGAILIAAALTKPVKRWVPAMGTAFTVVPLVRHDFAGAMVNGTF